MAGIAFMSKFEVYARSILFNLFLYFWVTVPTFAMVWIVLLPKRQFNACVRWWQSQVVTMERLILNLRYEVVGRENIPEGACIIAAKHESAWETLRLMVLFDDPAVVLKQELVRVPIWGWYAWRCGMIPVDRSGKAAALARMMKAANKAKDSGRKIVIFPQGTRIAPGVKAPYRVGTAALYQQLKIPVVPMALNSGLFWPKKGFLKKPGVVTIEFLPPIPPGLPRAKFMRDIEEQIETASDRLAGIAS